MASFFQDVTMAPPIEVFNLTRNYNEDESAQKVNLGVGAYRNEEGKPWVLPVVKKVEAQLGTDNTLNHEYLPVAGLKEFRAQACALILGKDSTAIRENRVEGIQAQGGTGALRLAAEFLKRNCNADVVYVSSPTWGNHKTIFKFAGYSQIREYRYWHAESRKLDFNGLLEDLRNAPKGAVVILHAVAHNPTGMDPTMDEWRKIADVMKDKGLFPLLDCAYQGFASGNLDSDARSVRLFVDLGFELFVAQSFSKNFGLYNERVGNLCIVANKAEKVADIRSQMEIIVRTMWSNPSAHGARVVATVLNNQALLSEWKENVKKMAERIQLMRRDMVSRLKKINVPGSWEHITNQIGMFSYTGLTEDQSKRMTDHHKVYMLKSGRISMAGVTHGNLEYVVDCMNEVITGQQRKK